MKLKHFSCNELWRNACITYSILFGFWKQILFVECAIYLLFIYFINIKVLFSLLLSYDTICLKVVFSCCCINYVNLIFAHFHYDNFQNLFEVQSFYSLKIFLHSIKWIFFNYLFICKMFLIKQLTSHRRSL